jgi:hypothetical protein
MFNSFIKAYCSSSCVSQWTSEIRPDDLFSVNIIHVSFIIQVQQVTHQVLNKIKLRWRDSVQVPPVIAINLAVNTSLHTDSVLYDWATLYQLLLITAVNAAGAQL